MSTNFLHFLETVRLLLMLGNATANQVNDFGASPLLVASANGHTQVVDMLVELGGADVQLLSNAGETALDKALSNNHLDTATLLVVHGCEPTLEDHPAGSAKRLALERGLSLRGPVLQLKQLLLSQQQTQQTQAAKFCVIQ